MAANDSIINTYGTKDLLLNFSLKRSLSWQFHIPDAPNPILGADCLNHFGLIVDIRQRKLIDPFSNTFAIGSFRLADNPLASILSHALPYHKILFDFPQITGAKPSKPMQRPMSFIT